MHEMSMSKAREVWGQLQNAKKRLSRVREESEGVVHRAKILGLGVGGTLAAGYLNAKKGVGGQPYQLFGFDADMALGFALAAAGLAGLGGKHADDLVILGSGVAGGWAYREGLKLGGPATTATTGFAQPGRLYQTVGAIPNQYAQPASAYVSRTGAQPANAYGR